MVQTSLMGRLLKADLTAGDCGFSPFPDEASGCLGGRGFNVWYLYHHLPRDIRALAPENILLISGGLLTGSAAPSGARLHINALSPLTGILGSSNIGGHTGARLSSCNLSSLIITGRAARPVYLYISEHGAEILDASHLWGLDAFETQDRLMETHGDAKPKILTIGPAGENQVRFAAVITGRDHAAGRTGMGAVMGSKNLKAVVIAKGGHKHFPANTPAKKQAVRTYAGQIKAAPEFKFFSRFGGAGYLQWAQDMGIMGAKNYTRVGTDNIAAIDGRNLEKRILKSSGCFKCPVQCKADLVMDPDRPEQVSTRPEFEPVINLGPKCGLEDLDAIVRLDNLCTRLGLDTTSTASVLAFAMDLFERGLLPPETCPGLDLTWGNAETMETLIRRIAHRREFGALLGQGVYRAAQALGPDTRAHAVHVKGLELTAYHPGTIMGTALGYAISSRGGDYNNVYAALEYGWSREKAADEFGTPGAVDIKTPDAKGRVIRKAVCANIIVDSLGLCKVPVLSLLSSFNLETEAALVRELTGMEITRQDLEASAGKIAAMEKWINIRHGSEEAMDDLPGRFFSDNETGRDSRLTPHMTRENFKAMLAEFYLAMGWDPEGIPEKPD